MKQKVTPFAVKSATHVLTGLGLLFIALFVASGQFRHAIPGYGTIKDRFLLLMANWNNDLRTEAVWTDNVWKIIDPEAFARECRISAREPGFVQWRSPIGTFWLPGMEGISSLIDMASVIQDDIYSYRGHGIRRGDVVVDCGAHVGSFTRKALDKGASLVIAIEPSADKVTCLKKNFAAEVADGKVRVLQVGLWSHDDTLWLAGISGVGNSVVSGNIQPGEGWGDWVRVRTLDKLVEEQCLARVDFIKMDIEGAECDAVKGGCGTIIKFKPFMVIGTEHTTSWAQNARNVIAAVKKCGVNYRLGFGRYGQTGGAPYAPMEVFFYQ